MNRSRLQCLALVAATALSLAACGQKSEAELIASAKTKLQQGEREAAVIELKSALQQNAASAEARYLLGKTLLESGDARNGVLELGKAHDQKYDDNAVLPLLARGMLLGGMAQQVVDLYSRAQLTEPRAAAQLKAIVGIAFASLGRLEQSQAAVDQALRLDPKNVDARLQDARLATRDRRFDEAFKQLDGALADAPRDTDAWHLQGEMLVGARGDIPGGIAAFRKAIEVDPTNTSAYSWLIQLLMQRQDIAGVRSTVQAMAKALPGRTETRYQQAQLALLDGRRAEARDAMQQLLKAGPRNVRFLALAGAIDYEEGALLLAEAHLSKVVQLQPGHRNARILLVKSYLRSGQADKALSQLQPLLEESKPEGEALALAATAHLQLGEPVRAERYFVRAAAADPGNAQVKTALALTAIAKGQVEAGFGELERLAASDRDTYADLALISARLRRGQSDEALTGLDRLQAKIPKQPLSYYMRGRVLSTRQDLAGARANYEKALQTDPAYFPAIAALADLDMAQKHPQDALKRYEAVLARDPRDFRALVAVAQLRKAMGHKPEDIAKLLAEAVRANPAEAAPRLLLVEHYIAEHDIKTALTVANEAAAALPDDFGVLDALGRAQLMNGQPQQAIASFGKAAAARPDQPLPLLRLADAYQAAKDQGAARDSLKRALKLEPDLVVAQRALIRLDLLEKHPEAALATARTVQRQRPNEATGYLLEAEIAAAQKQWPAAVNAAQAAMQRERSTETAMRLHGALQAAGRNAEAGRLAAAWSHDHPQDATFEEYLGSAALARQEWSEAEAHYRQLVKVRPDDALALNNIAWLLLQQKKAGAVDLASRAAALRPDSAPILDTLALALAADRQLDKALDAAHRAVSRAPQSPGYRLTLARLLLQSGDKAAARTELDTLAKLGDRFNGHAEVTALLNNL